MATDETSSTAKPWENPRYGRRTARLMRLRSFAEEMLDNPIFVKHKRTRLRRSQFMPTAIVVLVLTLCIAYGGYSLNGFANGGVYATTMTFQAILLAVMGASQIAASVGAARESGIIDYHRVSPVSPVALTLGFFFGAPVREYILYALTLPLALICVINESPSLSSFLETTIALFLSSWTMHALALLMALTSKKPKVGGRGIIGLIIFLFFFGGNFGFFAFRQVARSLDAGLTMSFFGIEIHWLLFTMLYSVPGLFFLLLASVRKMRSERAHPFTKLEAIGILCIMSMLLIGTLWGSPYYQNMVLVVVYVLVAVASVLITTVTPTFGEFTKGIRRAEREGSHHLKPWADWALNRTTVVIFASIFLAAATFVTQASPIPTVIPPGYGYVTPPEYSFSITIATAVFVIAYVGLAFQAFQLMMPTRATTIFALFLFLAWLVPIFIGAILSSAGSNEFAGQFALSMSPVCGLALSAGVGQSEGTRLFQAAAFCPALLFAFVFNNLVVIYRRKAIAHVHQSLVKTEPEVAA